MGKCYTKGTLSPGEKKFVEVLNSTGDFFRAVDSAYEVLQDNGVDITKAELQTYLRDNYVGAFGNDGFPVRPPVYSYTEGISEEKQKEINQKAKITGDLIKSAVSSLNEEQQITEKMAKELAAGEGDLEATIKQAKKAFGIDINPEGMTNERVAASILRHIQNRTRPTALGRLLKPASDTIKKFFAWENYSFSSYMSVMDRRGSETTDGGILEKVMHDKLRVGTQQISRDLDTRIAKFAEELGELYGENVYAGVDNNHKKATIQRKQAAIDYIKQKAVESSAVIETDIILNDGSLLNTSKGELMQLYLHSTNPEILASMERRGLSLGQLNELVDQYLTDADKQVALNMAHLYEEMYDAESDVFFEVYGKKAPSLDSYTGPVSLVDEVETDVTKTPNVVSNMRQTIGKLGNQQNKVKDRALDLNVNFYANAINRIKNSASYTGGEQIYNELYNAWNRSDVREEVLKNNPDSYHSAVNNILNEAFGLKKREGIPALLSFISRSVTFTALALKPKLALNQVTSSVFWLTEESTFDGFSKPEEYRDVNVSKLLFDNSITLRERYSNTDMTQLESSLNAAASELENITKAKSKFKKGRQWLSRAFMSPTALGDRVGIMAFGRAYFIGEYKRLRAEGKSHAEAEAEAIYRFGKKLSLTQQSFEKIDRSEMQKSGWSIFTMFQTTPRQFRREVADSSRQLLRAAQRKEYKGTVGKNLLRVATFHSAAGIMYQAVMQTLPALVMKGELDDEDWEKLVRAGILGSYYNSIFILGDIVQAFINQIDGYDFGAQVGRPTAWQSIEKVMKELLKVNRYANKSPLELNENQRLAYERAQWNAMAYTLQLLHMPVRQLGFVKDENGRLSLLNNIELYRQAGNDLLDGKMDPEAFLQFMGYGDWIIGESKPEEVQGRPMKKKDNPFQKGKNPFNKKKKDRFKKLKK